jgi:hypothetical protein
LSSPTKREVREITQLVQDGVPFEEAYSSVRGNVMVPVAPFLRAIAADERSQGRIERDCGFHPSTLRRIKHQTFIKMGTAEILCDTLNIPPREVGL